MSLRANALTLLLTGGLLCGCAGQASSPDPRPLTAEQTRILDRELGGKVADEPLDCLPPGNDSRPTVRVSDDILLYRGAGGVVYRNDLVQSCSGLQSEYEIIVADRGLSRLCRGQIIRLVDRTSGIQGASCALGKFTPYRTP